MRGNNPAVAVATRVTPVAYGLTDTISAMCDTLTLVQTNRVLFGKNSDRDANEGQNLEWHPSRLGGGRVRCTYIEIDDVPETRATLLSRPFWMWGAEMGANESGVVIGNEAVFTNEPYEREPGLIGMDLLRLALERADTAEQACEVITLLLEQHGQGGGCGHESKKFVYHNSFIVADCTGAFVLETAGRKWSIEKVTAARSISNALTIPSFRDQYSDFLKTRVSGGRVRQPRTQELCKHATTVADVFAILRDHGTGRAHPEYAWSNGGLHAPCVHAGGVLANSQTTASWVAELTPQGAQHWVTATAAPCTGLFKPVAVDTPVNMGPRAKDVANDSLWWRHERFHRRVARNPAVYFPLFMDERDSIEAEWLSNRPESAAAFAKGDPVLAKWTDAVFDVDAPDVRPTWTRRFWAKRDARAGLIHHRDIVVTEVS